jgi:hypothetical protein
LYLHMEASQHSLLAACFTLHSINATLAIVPQRGAGLWIRKPITSVTAVLLQFVSYMLTLPRNIFFIVQWLYSPLLGRGRFFLVS